MKKKLCILSIIGLCLLTLTGCNSKKDSDDNKEKTEEVTDALKFKEEYESLNGTESSSGKTIRTIEIPSDNPFIYKSAKDIVESMDNEETFIVYFGFPTCPWCRSVLPTLISVAKDNGVDKIYYVNVKDIRDVMELNDKGKPEVKTNGTEDYNKLLEKLDNVLSDYTLTDEDGKEVKTGEKRIYAPNIITVIDGKAKKITTGISDKQTDGYMELTDEMIDDMKDAFKKVINEYTSATASCDINSTKC